MLIANQRQPPKTAQIIGRRCQLLHDPLPGGLDAVLGAVQATPAKQHSPPGRAFEGGRRQAIQDSESSG